ncbi:prepilin-type N-terminal cleavage/methylation domain-containing protein [Candidatus Nomurabacteria bacterium]|nr:prepilin-type N-terminal cleavage/methylation domain-containing protein [Candidatus Nomurabacteria bacterium]
MIKINLHKNKGFTRSVKDHEVHSTHALRASRSYTAGFTLLETLIAIFIMVVAFASLLSLMTTTMFSARYATNEITATYLAQEAVDYIRNDRDTTAIIGGDWIGFINHYGNYQTIPATNCYATAGCYFDVTDTTYSLITPCLTPPGSCPNLNYEESPASGGYYISVPSSTSVPTKFKRTVTIIPGNFVGAIPEELMITVRVDWSNGSRPRSQILRASLLKWQ